MPQCSLGGGAGEARAQRRSHKNPLPSIDRTSAECLADGRGSPFRLLRLSRHGPPRRMPSVNGGRGFTSSTPLTASCLTSEKVLRNEREYVCEPEKPMHQASWCTPH
jgi:hypothetical protein